MARCRIARATTWTRYENTTLFRSDRRLHPDADRPWRGLRCRRGRVLQGPLRSVLWLAVASPGRRHGHDTKTRRSSDLIVAYIQTLIDRGAAYAAGGDVYFRVRSDPSYGSLSHRTVDDMDTIRKHDALPI